MTAIEALIIKHPVATYFALTFTISWGGVLWVIGGPGGISGTTAHDDPLFPFAVLAMIVGPSVAGILLTGLRHGMAGFRELRARLSDWQIDVRLLALTLLAAPALAIAASLALLAFSPEFIPRIAVADHKASLLLFALAVALAAGLVEEMGWTGFAVPELRRRYGVVTTGLIVGMMWSAWHVLVVVWGIGSRAGSIPLALFVLLDGFAVLPAFRVFMVWVYDRTGSLPIAMVMHVGLTVSTLILWPVTAGASLLTYDFVVATAVWMVVALLTLVSSRPFTRSPLRRRTA